MGYSELPNTRISGSGRVTLPGYGVLKISGSGRVSTSEIMTSGSNSIPGGSGCTTSKLVDQQKSRET